MPTDIKYYIDRAGELFVSTRITAKDLMDLLNDKLPTMLELQRAEQKYSANRDFVEVRLGLKILSMDYNYYYSHKDAVQHCNEATEKLQRLSEKLRALQLSGMTMAISDHYGLNVDGSLFIKWDFTDEEVVLLLEGVKEKQDKSTEQQQEQQEGTSSEQQKQTA